MRGDLILAVLGLTVSAGTWTGAQQCESQPSEPRPANSARPLRATFLGVSTILLDDGQTAIMIDGFFSRPGSLKTLLGRIAPDTARIDRALNKTDSLTTNGTRRMAAVLVAHSHHDHAMDAAIVARREVAAGRIPTVIVGSKSTANVALGVDPRSRIDTVKGGEQCTFGDFNVRIVSSPHSPDEVFKGEIDSLVRPPAFWGNYKGGSSNFSFLVEHQGRRVLIHPSANFQRDSLRGKRADVVFLSIGMLGKQDSSFIDDYWQEVVKATGAKLVIPIHWDNFSKPLDQPLKRSPWPIDDVKKALKELTRLSKANNITMKMPAAFETIDLSASHTPTVTPRATPPPDR